LIEKKTDFEWEIPSTELVQEKSIGEGCFGKVWKGKWRGISVAIKELHTESLEDFKNEIGILGKMRHPNIILYMGACTETGKMCIVTEFLGGGNLAEQIQKGVKFPIKTVIKIAKQTSFGLNYLHLSNIIHRDLKPANLLMDATFENVKLCDFGLSAHKKKTQELSSAIGTPIYQAPEMMMEEKYDESVDVYAFSVCTWEILCSKDFLDDPNFKNVADYKDLLDAVVVQKKRPTIPPGCPAGLKDLLCLCWDSLPAKRPNMANIIAQLERIA